MTGMLSKSTSKLSYCTWYIKLSTFVSSHHSGYAQLSWWWDGSSMRRMVSLSQTLLTDVECSSNCGGRCFSCPSEFGRILFHHGFYRVQVLCCCSAACCVLSLVARRGWSLHIAVEGLSTALLLPCSNYAALLRLLRPTLDPWRHPRAWQDCARN